jgi:hypothetical protein
MNTYTPNQWVDIAKDLHEEICLEFARVQESGSYNESYPKFVVLVNFFRMFRGEGLSTMRPQGMGELQKEIYGMESDIEAKLEEIRSHVDVSDEKFQFYLKQVTRI